MTGKKLINKNMSKEKQKIEIQFGLLKQILEWLDIPLHGQEARDRNAVFKIIKEKFDEYEKERMVIIEKYCKREKDGSLKMVVDPFSGGKKYDIENMESFEKDFRELSESVAIFDVLPSTKNGWVVVKKIFADTKKAMDIETTTFWEKILLALENI